MKDLQMHLAKIRQDAAECNLLSNIGTDGKREVFARVAEHLNALALEIEKTIATNGFAEKAATAETPVPVSMVGSEVVDLGPEGHATVAGAVDRKQAAQSAQSRRMLPFLLVIALAAVAGTLIWVNHRAENVPSTATMQSKSESSAPPQDDIRQALAAVLSEQQREGRALREQLNALATRVDDLGKARSEIAVPSTRHSDSAEEKPGAAKAQPSTQDKPVRIEEKSASSPEKPAAVENPNSDSRRSDGAPPGNGTPVVEPADRVGAIPVPTRAGLDLRKPPPGCTQFRSFDPLSGTYTTLSGRRRQCR